jgi:hypothetical protein
VVRIIRLLIQKPIPPSRKIQHASRSALNQATWAVTLFQKYFPSLLTQIKTIPLAVLPHLRGVSRSSRTRGGMRWTRQRRRRTTLKRTVKSCGPDASTPASSLAEDPRQYPPAVIARESGRSSIPETSVTESISRGVLDTPHARGMTANCAPDARILPPLRHFPFP